jgi:uncharacterized membrane protein
MVMKRIAAILGILSAITALVLLVRVGHPEIATGAQESSWAPQGIHGLGTPRGITALSFAGASLILLILALQPRKRATPATFFDEEERQAIRRAIAAAEDRTSGEIRVHLQRCTPGDALDAARSVFEKIGMTRTAARNGVLIYLSVEDHRFAILGDEGIDRVVPENFWGEIRTRMGEKFQEDRFAEGIVEAVEAVGENLHRFFPVDHADRNELSDEISMEEGR